MYTAQIDISCSYFFSMCSMPNTNQSIKYVVHVTVYVYQQPDYSMPCTIGSLSWGGDILCSGSRDHNIFAWDYRTPTLPIKKYLGHTQEVCGLKWSPDHQLLASGGNDNKVMYMCVPANIIYNTGGLINCYAHVHVY